MNDVKQVALAALEALVAGDTGHLEQHPGHWQSRQYFPIFVAGLTERRLTVHTVIAEGETVAIRATLEATHSGPFLGVAGTGERIAFDLFSIEVVRDGLVVQHTATADLVGVLGSFGLLTPRQ